jgi:hypothetical protein
MDIAKTTTIKIDKETKLRLDKLKVHPKESYDEILQKMLHILNLCKVTPEAAKTKLLAIDSVKRLQEIQRTSKAKNQPPKSNNPNN